MKSPLDGVALFKELPEPGLQMLAERGRPKHFATGEVIMRAGRRERRALRDHERSGSR